MTEEFEFIHAIDRYLDVSHQYYRRAFTKIEGGGGDDSDRYRDLLEEIQGFDCGRPTMRLDELRAECDSPNGEAIRIDKENIDITEKYLSRVRDLIKDAKRLGGDAPKNIAKLQSLFDKSAEEYLCSFGSLSYAWDILIKAGNLTSVPEQSRLYARDMKNMGFLELRQHLHRMLVISMQLDPSSEVDLKGRFNVGEMNKLQDAHELVQRIVGASAPSEIDEMLKRIDEQIAVGLEGPRKTKEGFLASFVPDWEETRKMLEPLATYGYGDGLFAGRGYVEESLRDALEKMNNMVSLGLVVGYLLAFSYAFKVGDPSYSSIILRHGHFCTRSLLDERRWSVCRDLTALLREIAYYLHDTDWQQSVRNGCGMLEANWLFSRKMCGDDIDDDLKSWRVQDMGLRCQFLNDVLKGEFEPAVEIAKELAVPGDNGHSNMLAVEFQRWPILAEFRESDCGREFMATLKD